MNSNALRVAHIGLLNDIFSVAQDPLHPGMSLSVAQTIIEYLKRTPLTAAIKWEQYQWISPLLELGENPNEFNNLGYTPLMAAALKANLQIFKLIQEKGGEVSLRHPITGLTALFTAIQGGNIEILRLVLNTESIDPNQTEAGGFTPLHMAADSGKFEVLTELLQVGGLVINPNSPAGLIPFHYAVIRGEAQCVQLLIDCGADIESKTENTITIGEKTFLVGSTPLSIAQQLGFTEIVTIIQRAYEKSRSIDSSSSELLDLANIAATVLQAEYPTDVVTTLRDEKSPAPVTRKRTRRDYKNK